ncbi:MAG: hypothetical protein KDA80_11110 [Planctomycetaceae bacterium]|nr:hypothetical protein [Planctomycetaceae bacterium]
MNDSARQAGLELQEIEKTKQSVEKILESLRAKTMEGGVESSSDYFAKLQSSHHTRELVWCVLFCVASIATIAAIVYVSFFHEVSSGQGIASATSFALKSILIASAPVLFLKICLTKYNAERNLSIIYGHRNAVLSQYMSFEAAIGDDVESKNAFRLEIAKFIFSDPQTGYLNQSHDTSDINFNPIVKMVEGMGKS